jgi:hypothetical protein
VVNIAGKSKGKGFQGGIKRHGWKGGKASHGSMFHRGPGSIGASAYPSRVVPGHPLPGHMGNERVTVRHLSVVSVIPDQNLILLKGPVPGPKFGLLEIHLAARPEGVEPPSLVEEQAPAAIEEATATPEEQAPAAVEEEAAAEGKAEEAEETPKEGEE